MTPDSVMAIAQHAMEILLLVAAPPLGAALLAGLIVSIFQAATQINEMTLSFIPKLLAMFAVLLVFGHWMLMLMVGYLQNLIHSIPGLMS